MYPHHNQSNQLQNQHADTTALFDLLFNTPTNKTNQQLAAGAFPTISFIQEAAAASEELNEDPFDPIPIDEDRINRINTTNGAENLMNNDLSSFGSEVLATETRPLSLEALVSQIYDKKPRTCSSKHYFNYDDPDVLLKEQSESTIGTRLFKDHTRAVFPRSGTFDLAMLLNFQDMCYRCKCFSMMGPDWPAPKVTFWVSLEKTKQHESWAAAAFTGDSKEEQKEEYFTPAGGEIRYLKKKDSKTGKQVDIPFVRASEDCLRHELETSGGKSAGRRAAAAAAKKRRLNSAATNEQQQE